MDNVECEICAQLVPLEKTQRLCSVNICDRCFNGVEDGLSHLDRFGELKWRWSSRDWDKQGTGLYAKEAKHAFVVMTGTVDLQSGVEAVFSKEYQSLGDFFRKTFGREPKHRDIQVGDSFFDEKVLIRTSTDERTIGLLSVEPVKAAIFDFITHGGTVVINQRTMEAIARQASAEHCVRTPLEEPWIHELLLSGGVLFAQLARFAGAERDR